MSFNLSNVTNATTIVDITIATNNLVNGLLGAFILTAIFVVLFISMSRYDTKTVFVASSFITVIAGTLMVFLQFIGWPIIIYPIILFLTSIVIYLFSSRN